MGLIDWFYFIGFILILATIFSILPHLLLIVLFFTVGGLIFVAVNEFTEWRGRK